MALRDKPSGTVRLTISDHAYDTSSGRNCGRCCRTIPTFKLEFSIDNGLRNIVEDRFDAGVRLGESVDKDMIAVRIGPDWRLVAVASPGYFAGAAGSADAAGSRRITTASTTGRRRAGGLYAWEFAKDGRELRVEVEGQLTFNSTLPMVDAAIAGLRHRLCRRRI